MRTGEIGVDKCIWFAFAFIIIYRSWDVKIKVRNDCKDLKSLGVAHDKYVHIINKA